jgi:hypothetical protein
MAKHLKGFAMPMPNILSASTQFATRVTVGNALSAKQDRAENARRLADLIGLRAGDPRPLTRADYVRVAERYDVEPWKIHGVVDQEVPNGSGFDTEGRMICVPELHQWSKRTAFAYAKKCPDLHQDKFIQPSRVPKGHPYRLGNTDRWDVLARMAALDFDRALESSSFGAFQFMGFNWKKLSGPSYESVFDLVKYLYTGHRAQLDVIVRLWIADGGFEPLRRGDWVSFAKVQNGPARAIAYAGELREKAENRRIVYA